MPFNAFFPSKAEGTPGSVFIDLSNDSDDELSMTEDDKYSESALVEEEELDQVEEFLAELTLEEFNDALARQEARDTDGYASQPQYANHLPALTTSCTTLPFGCVTIESCTVFGGFQLKAGLFVELLPDHPALSQTDGDFLRISSILKDLNSDEILLRGTRFRRTKYNKGMLERKLNEIYMLQRSNQEDPRSIYEQSLENVPIESVLCTRTVILTNQTYPSLSWKVWTMFSTRHRKETREIAQLVCRFKHSIVYSTPVYEKAGRIEEQRLERLSEKEADDDYAISDQVLRSSTLDSEEPSIPTDPRKDGAVSSYKESMRKHRQRRFDPKGKTVIDLDDDEPEIVEIADGPEILDIDDDDLDRGKGRKTRGPTTHGQSSSQGNELARIALGSSGRPSRTSAAGTDFDRRHFNRNGHSPSRPYTFGDACCGAGGISSGARSAGLDIKWGFDNCPAACRTYRANFRDVRVFVIDAHDFIVKRWKSRRRVDIIHISPPCQAWSPAHTIPGKDDDANEASLFSVGCLIQRARPRIVTVEETSGIATHHPIFLHALILQLTLLGYSVGWKIMNFAEYGLAQHRRRLIMIASCPGEPLPPFPKRTHGLGPGLKPYTTIRAATASIRPGMPNHDESRCVRRALPPYDPDTQLRACITCDGGKTNLHWSGKRTFTERELASLQGLPTGHVFLGKKGEVLRQIGNAVPGIVAEQLYRPIIESLRATDAAEIANGGRKDTGESREEGKKDTGESREDAIMLD